MSKFILSCSVSLLLIIVSFLAPLNRVSAQSNSKITALASAQLSELGLIIPRFAAVSPVLYRGGQPRLEKLRQLKDCGIKTVVDLRDGRNDIAAEKLAAEKAGIRFVSIPLSVFRGVSQDNVRKFLSVVDDPESQPVFVHCRQGQDRCGTMVAIYRMQRQSWTRSKACAEMLKFGFRPFFIGLAAAVLKQKPNSGTGAATGAATGTPAG